MSLQYYQNNAHHFFYETVNVDMTELYQYFVPHLAKDALILDAGCGSGRDTKAFIQMGFHVEAIDGSEKMVEMARQLTQLDVKLKTFQEIDAVEKYDAIWACASLLHVTYQELPIVFKKMFFSLKPNGIWYLSFKYGDEERLVNGRLFTDLNENKLESLISPCSNLQLVELWITEDNRVHRKERWFNAILKKSTNN